MSELTDITATFQKASDSFIPILSKPNDGNLQRLNKMLVVFCLSVTLTGTATGSPSGVVLPESVYKANHGGASFNFMHSARADYEPAIQNLTKDDHALMMHSQEHSWAAGTANQSLIHAIEVGERNLILANVEPTWVKELSVPGTFYTSITFRAILVHLEKYGTSLDRPAGL